jgi:hypothetical protein
LIQQRSGFFLLSNLLTPGRIESTSPLWGRPTYNLIRVIAGDPGADRISSPLWGRLTYNSIRVIAADPGADHITRAAPSGKFHARSLTFPFSSAPQLHHIKAIQRFQLDLPPYVWVTRAETPYIGDPGADRISSPLWGRLTYNSIRVIAGDPGADRKYLPPVGTPNLQLDKGYCW